MNVDLKSKADRSFALQQLEEVTGGWGVVRGGWRGGLQRTSQSLSSVAGFARAALQAEPPRLLKSCVCRPREEVGEVGGGGEAQSSELHGGFFPRNSARYILDSTCKEKRANCTLRKDGFCFFVFVT